MERRIRNARTVVSCLALLLAMGALGGLTSGCSRPSAGEREAATRFVVASATGSNLARADVATATRTLPPPTVTPTPTAPAPVAAIVNGQYVFIDDLDARLAVYGGPLRTGGPNTEGSGDQRASADDRLAVLECLIDLVLIEQAAAAMGVSVDDRELAAQVIADIQSGGGQSSFDEWLGATEQTKDGYASTVRQSMVTQRVLEAVTSGMAGMAGEFEQVHARHIAVFSEEEAQAIADRLNQGADFEALARELSEDQVTRDAGGDLGWFPRGLVEPELEEAAFALLPGEASEPVFYHNAYHVVQVVAREAERRLPAETRAHLVAAAFEEWLAKERAEAEIDRFLD